MRNELCCEFIFCRSAAFIHCLNRLMWHLACCMCWLEGWERCENCVKVSCLELLRHFGIERVDVFEVKIEKAGSQWELNPAHLACAAMVVDGCPLP